MGTNFYFHTQNKEFKKWVDENYKFYADNCIEIVDTPDFGYEMHIAKTSFGWLPLFQARPFAKSIEDYKRLYKNFSFKIYDEYGTEYSWEQFDERVLKFNGGYDGAMPKTKNIYIPTDSSLRDLDMPSETPVSHFTYGNGKYAHMYFKDNIGYEFTNGDFS